MLRHTLTLSVYASIGLLAVASRAARAADCNANGVEDDLDLLPVRFVLKEVHTMEGPYGGLAVGDFDDNGTPDIAVPLMNPWEYWTSRVKTFLNAGGAVFNSTRVTPIEIGDYHCPARIAMLALDPNADSFDDLVLGNNCGSAALLFSNGDGTFTTSPLDMHFGPGLMAAADVNGDDLDDVISANRGFGRVLIALNGSGCRCDLGVTVYGEHEDTPQEIKPVDIDRDGHLDLAIRYKHGVSIIVNTGNGVDFIEHANAIGYSPNGLRPALFEIGKFAAHAWRNPDVVVVDEDDNVFVYPNYAETGAPFGFQSSWQLDPSGLSNARAIVKGRFNDDYLDDLAIANGGSDSGELKIAIYLNSSSGFDPPRLFEFSAFDSREFVDMAAEDLDGDGDDDLALVGYGSGPGAPLDDPKPTVLACLINQSERLAEDCNENGVPDECEPDGNGDGMIDDCESCGGGTAMAAPMSLAGFGLCSKPRRRRRQPVWRAVE